MLTFDSNFFYILISANRAFLILKFVFIVLFYIKVGEKGKMTDQVQEKLLTIYKAFTGIKMTTKLVSI